MYDAPRADAPPRSDGSELAMARAALKVGVPMAVLAVAIVGPWRGTASALTALGAIVVVVGNFYVTGRSLAWAARISLTVLQAVALGGLFLRLVLYAVLILLLRPVEAIDGPVLAVTAAVAMVVLLAYETRFVLATSQLWWLHDASSAPSAGSRALGKDRP